MPIKGRSAYLYLASLIISVGVLFGQSGKYTFLPTSAVSQKRSSFVKGGDVFGTRVFVENKGQFDSKGPNNEKIHYAYDDGVERIYFTSRGLIYEKIKNFPLSEKQREAQEEGKNVKEKDPEIHYTFMNWVNTGATEPTIESGEMQHHYITYGSAEYNSRTFKKITYKNVYNNIDVEYSIPENKEYGIKYSVMMHPGADPTKIRILYSGAVNKVKLNSSGEVVIKTPLDDITEHLPTSYYENQEKVASKFTLHHDTIGFEFPEGIQKNRSVIIDPWVTSVTTLTLNNLCFDVDYDLGGNAFVFGSFGYAKLAMYNLAGILQWTFSGILVTPSWSSQAGLSGSVGNFVVDKFTSKTYIGPGQGNPRIIRLTQNGVYDNFITPTTTLYQELWEMGFHCMSGEIFVLGGGHTSNLSAATINTVSATLNLSTFQPLNTAFVHDISAQCIDDAGNIFVYYACSNGPLNHKICRVNSTF
ncbi:MAG: hypothetical protein PSX36_13425 [bacterium]|nr:hypothetical protein [bacterium]